MALYFNAPKDGSTFATIGGSLESANSRLDFSEARIQKSEDGTYILFMQLDKATDLQAIGDKNWKFSPCLAQITLHKTEYERNKKVGDKWEKEKTSPTELEVFLCELFEEKADIFLAEDKAFSGFINLWDSPPTFKAIRTGKQADGSPIPEAGIAYILSNVYAVEPCEIDKLKELPQPQAKKSWGGGAKGQNEAEILKERKAFFLQTMNELKDEKTTEFATLNDTVYYLCNYSEDTTDHIAMTREILHLLMRR